MLEFQENSVKEKFPIFFKVGNYFRTRRMNFFFHALDIKGNEKILDVGGEPLFWKHYDFIRDVTILNLHKTEELDGIKSLTYAGGDLPFKDKEFDVIFSNSVIEHVGDFLAQKRFASEIERCGKKFFVQVPSYWFPYEPHSHIPFFQFVPAPIRIFLRKLFTKSTYSIEELLSINLLTKAELKLLFPGMKIKTERLLFFPKSYFIIKNEELEN